jgi:3-hydroxyacyl-CoA dehydrogenase
VASILQQNALSSVDGGYSAAAAYLAHAKTQVHQIPETRGGYARPVHRAGVIGGGTMGVGISVALLDAGLTVTLLERDDSALIRGMEGIKALYGAMTARKRMTTEDVESRLARLAGSTSFDALTDADIVIEAVFEDLEVKQAVFRELDRVCKPEAVLATNTSYLDIVAIARVTSRPVDVLGLHFFSPAHIMKLLEIVVPPLASVDAVATAFGLAAMLRKVPVRAGICDGFVGNRILAAYRAAADALMEDGASPYQVDAAMQDFGFPMGPYQVLDLAGGQIAWAGRKRRAATRDPAARYVGIPDRLCENGWFGQKTGRGFYRYDGGARKGTPDPEVEALIERERALAGVAPRAFCDDQIVRRCVAAIINESANVVDEGIALRPLDVDMAMVHGFGFPAQHGGPLFFADATGLGGWLNDIRAFGTLDPVFWRPSPLLERCVAQNLTLARLDTISGLASRS